MYDAGNLSVKTGGEAARARGNLVYKHWEFVKTLRILVLARSEDLEAPAPALAKVTPVGSGAKWHNVSEQPGLSANTSLFVP